MALSICLSFSLSLRPRCLSIVLPSCLPVPVHMCNLPIFLSFLLSLFNSYICLSVSAIVNVCLTVFLLFIVPFFHNSVAATVCLQRYISVCLYVSKSLCLFVRFSICIFCRSDSFCRCVSSSFQLSFIRPLNHRLSCPTPYFFFVSL